MIFGPVLVFAVSIVSRGHAEEAGEPTDAEVTPSPGHAASADGHEPPEDEDHTASEDEQPVAEVDETAVNTASAAPSVTWHPPDAAPPVVVYPVETFTLPNGLEIVLQPDERHPRVAVSVTYGVGERDQPEGLRGIVPMIEGLMGRGSRNVEPGGHDRHLDHAGATERGSLITSDDSTFYEEIPSNHLATALWLESDRMASLLAVVDREAVDSQRALLADERTRTLSRNALHGLDVAVARVLYPAAHPYHRVGDSDEELSRIRLEHIQYFFQLWYAPHNARLAIVGDFEIPTARDLVERYFGSISSSYSTPPRRLEAAESRPLSSDRRVTFGSLASARQVRVMWPSPAFLTPGDAELDGVAYILGRGDSSRLVRRLVTESGMATEVFARQYSFELASYFMIFAEAAPDQALDEIVAIIDEEVARLCESPPEPREFERAQYLNRAREIISDESFSTRAVSLSRIRSPLSDDGFYRLEHDLERYAAVTAEGVQRTVCRFLPRDRRLVVSVVPWNDAPDEGAVISDEVLP